MRLPLSHLLAMTAMTALGAPSAASDAPAEGQARGSTPQPRMPALPPAQIDDTLAVGGDEIDARKLRTRMTVQVRINDTGPYRFVVDSGADTSVVGERISTALRLRPGQPTMLNGITDSQPVQRVFVDELELGPSRLFDLEVPVLKESNIGAEGMVGLDALVQQRLMLDFEKRQISVDDGRRKDTRMDGEIVVRARLQRGQLILTQVMANKVSVDAIIDTGSEVSIGNAKLRDALMLKNSRQFQTITVIGVTGTPAELQLIRVSQLKLGSVTLRDVPIAFADIPPFAVFGIDDQPSLLLGTDVMETFRRVQLDFRERRVRFQLRKCAQVVRISTTGNYASRLSTDNEATCRR
jgi:hypothetical protein